MSLHPARAYQYLNQYATPAGFASDLQHAINAATTRREYRRTVVIAFHWQNDRYLDVEPLETHLLTTLRIIYDFHTTSFVIPLVQSQVKLLE